MGTNADSIINIPDLVKTFRKGDHNSILPSHIKFIGDNSCLRRDIGPIYDIFLKWFEEGVQRIAMARPKKMAIHCYMNHWMRNLQGWPEIWVPGIQT